MLRVNFNDSSSTYTDSVYQWDLNQVLEIAGLDLPVSPVIHFCNRNSTESLLVQSTTSEGVISCPVPNILLKEDLDIVAYIVSMEDQKATTLFKVLIPVNKRVKPSDYEYTDNVPILTYEAIEADIQTYFNKSKSYVDFATNRLATNFAKAIFIEKGTTVYGGGFELYSLGNLLLIKHIPGVLATGSTSDKKTLFEYGEQYPAVSEDEDRKLVNGITLTLTTDRKVKYSTPDTITSGLYSVESGIDIFMTDAIVDPAFNPITTVVTELPTTNINSNTMYLLKKSDNTYEEYMFVDNKWLNIGGDYSDAEVIDARTGYDGTSYDTLGTAIRTQVSELKGDLATLKTTQDNPIDLEKTDFFNIETLSENRFDWNAEPYIDNMLFTGSGEKTAENTEYYISQFMRIDGGKTYYQNLNSPICLYDNAHKYIRTVKYNESPFVADENAKYVRCSVQRSRKASKYISEVKQIGTQAGYVTPFTGDKVIIANEELQKAIQSEQENIIKTVYGDNRFNVSEPHYADNAIIQYGNIIDKENYFISHLMIVKPNTTYYKNEAGDGIFYDEKMNIVGLSNNEGLTFTSPDNAFYYRCSLSNGIASKFYVSIVDKISSFGDTYELEQPAKSAVEKVVKDLNWTGEGVIEKRISKISDSLNGTSPIEKAIVTFIDDDGAKVINTIVLPYLKETKTKLGVAIITGAIGSTDYYMTENELLECHKSGYVETLSHCHNQYTALTSLSEDELHYQYATSKEWLESHGFEAESFVYPQNTTNKLVRKTAREYYKYCFTGISFNSEKYLDHSLINRIAFGSFESYNPEISGISDKGSLDYYKACVDIAIENGQWLVFNTHFGIETSHTTNEQLTLFKSLVDYIKSKRIEIVFPSEGFALKRNIISFGDKDETHLFLGNNDFDSRNIIGSRITPIGDKTNQTPITEYKSGIILISTIDYAHGHGGKFPADQGILETYRDASWLGYSYQKFTELKTCKQYMRFWDADVTNSWLSWVSIN